MVTPADTSDVQESASDPSVTEKQTTPAVANDNAESGRQPRRLFRYTLPGAWAAVACLSFMPNATRPNFASCTPLPACPNEHWDSGLRLSGATQQSSSTAAPADHSDHNRNHHQQSHRADQHANQH